MNLRKNRQDAFSSLSRARRIQGQGLTEYAIIVALVVIAAITATSYFGDTVKATFVALGSELSGAEKFDAAGNTQASRNQAINTATETTTLKNYAQ